MAKIVARDWYAASSVGDGITLISETHVAAWLRCNIWHVRGRDRDLIIDTGMGLRPLTREVAGLVDRPLTAIMTHSHFDHSGGMHEFTERGGHPAEAAVMAAPNPGNTVADTGYVRAETFSALPWDGFAHESYQIRPAPLTRLLDEGDVIDLGDRAFNVFHLPGHSPGSIALFEAKTGILFSGDVVYEGAMIDDLYHSDPAELARSMTRLKELPVSTVHGGHFASFGRARMIDIIDEYLAGGRRLANPEAWIAGEIGRTQGGAGNRENST